MGLTSEADKCSTGGSPTEAFERLLMLPRSGVTEAGAPTFKYQNPGSYTGRLNHVVLVIGYFVLRNDGSQNRIAPPFWIIRNSWGVEWGDRGHMRIDIQGGDGVCGINVLPGIYPIVKIPKDPCGQKSFKGDGDLQPTMNPCGRFACRANLRSNSNSCNCTIPNESKQPFVEVANGYGFQTCAYLDVCGADLKNPCYVGACINDGKGSYSCICPPNYVASTTIDNFPTCDPANLTASTLAVRGSNWWCSDVLPLVGLPLALFTQQNVAIDCSRPLPRNIVLQLGSPLPVPCTAFFYTLNGDTCWSIGTQLGLSSSNFTALNPGLDCSKAIKAGASLCIERNATFAFTVPRCLQYGVLTAQDTCERLLQQMAGGEDGLTGSGKVNAMRWAELYRNNPSLICSNVIPASASAVGSNTGVQICLRAEYWPFVVGICKKAVPPASPSSSPTMAAEAVAVATCSHCAAAGSCAATAVIAVATSTPGPSTPGPATAVGSGPPLLPHSCPCQRLWAQWLPLVRLHSLLLPPLLTPPLLRPVSSLLVGSIPWLLIPVPQLPALVW
ncbi:unnamed protein product [Closterium sp. NIES-65]|nr:unnamed protein product [Closterium sp. NIES-65]